MNLKRLSVILVVALLATCVCGCRYAIIESDSIQVRAFGALAEENELMEESAEEEAKSLFDIKEIDLTPMYEMQAKQEADAKKKTVNQADFVPVEQDHDEPDDYENNGVIGLHSRDEEGESKVYRLQARLHELGYLAIEPDGVFGSKTLKALKKFQNEQGIEQTGVLDDATKAVLYPQPAVTTAPDAVKYSEGDEGEDVRMVQRRLRQYGFSTRIVSGDFTEDTYDEVMAFQVYGVEHYGTEFDDPVAEEPTPEPTAEVVTFADYEPTPEPTLDPFGALPDLPDAAPAATLRPDHPVDGAVSDNLYRYLESDRFPVYYETVQNNDEGEEVERVQNRLITLDYYYEEVDGLFDDATEQAVKTFQRRNDLQQTGIADEETQRRLFSENAVAAEKVDQPFYIKVSITEQRVYVYRWDDGGYNQLVKTMICSTGFGNTTPKGVFVSPGQRDARWHYFAAFHCWAQYAFIIKGDILFHSVIFSRKDEGSLRQSTLRNLGRKASHGCVRLRVEDARWIYTHCGAGQVVEIY